MKFWQAALGTSHGTGVVGGDERVVGLFEGSHVGRDAQCLLLVLGQLLADVVEEALEDGRLLLIGELGNSSTILVEEVRLDGVADGAERLVVIRQIDQLEAQADALVDEVALLVGCLHDTQVLGRAHGALEVDEERGDLGIVQLRDREGINRVHSFFEFFS